MGTIVGVEEYDGRLTVTLEFSEPQPTDVDGVSSYRFELDFRSITSTWMKAELEADVQPGQKLLASAHSGNSKEEGGKKVRAVTLTHRTLIFSLPDDFGSGWEYRNVKLFGQGHAWAGSYDKDETGNFAHDVLLQVQGIQSSYLAVGLSCIVDFKVPIEDMTSAEVISSRLQSVVDAFDNRPERTISVRGSNFYDAKVTEHDANDPETEVVSDMPFLNYLAKYVPMAETLPALYGHDLDALRAQADEHQLAKRSINND